MSSIIQIRAGKTVKLTFAITLGLPPVLTDPPILPTVSIQDPGGTIVSSGTATKVSVGIYTYTYVTSSGGLLGSYVAWLDAIDSNGNPSGSLKVTAYQLVAA